MNHGGREAVAHKFLRQPLGASLGSCEDQRLALLCIKELPETVEFFSWPHFVGLELYAFSGLEHRAQSEPNRIAHVLTYEAGDGQFHRGRETQRLPLLGQS